MNRKWKKLWIDAIATVLISLFCTVVGLGLVYIVCGLFSLLYKVLIGG
jgi:hypothetical protein